MTPAELANFKHVVRGKILDCEDDEEVLIRKLHLEQLISAVNPVSAVEKHVHPPYAVMGSIVMDPSVNVVWPIRQYAWYAKPTCSAV